MLGQKGQTENIYLYILLSNYYYFLHLHVHVSLYRSQSAGRLSDMLLMAAFGPGGPVGERGSTENLTSAKAIDITGTSVH